MNREEFNRVLTERLERLVSHAGAIGTDLGSANVDMVAPIQSIGVIAIDIDHFKQVNDTYGHLYGDIVLRSLAVRLETLLRRLSEEMGLELLPAHPSGEEFSHPHGGESDGGAGPRDRRGGAAGNRPRGPMPTDAEWAELTHGETVRTVCRARRFAG